MSTFTWRFRLFGKGFLFAKSQEIENLSLAIYMEIFQAVKRDSWFGQSFIWKMVKYYFVPFC